jgi:hypothetical protein
MLHDRQGSIETAGALSGAGLGRRRMFAIAGLCLTMLIVSMAPGYAAGKGQTAKYWKGKYINEAVKKLGQPTQTTPLIGSGGNMYIFAQPNRTHWVFETEPGGKIVKAAKIE